MVARFRLPVPAFVVGLVLGFVLAPASDVRAQSDPQMRTVDTGLGFSLSVPDAWTRGQPSRNDKFVIGAPSDDFSVIVADFGQVQADAVKAADVYRESFLKNGLTPVTETDTTVMGKPAKRYVFRLDTPSGQGHAEAVMVPVGDEVYAVLVVTPSAAADARRATIAKILESVHVQ